MKKSSILLIASIAGLALTGSALWTGSVSASNDRPAVYQEENIPAMPDSSRQSSVKKNQPQKAEPRKDSQDRSVNRKAAPEKGSRNNGSMQNSRMNRAPSKGQDTEYKGNSQNDKGQMEQRDNPRRNDAMPSR